MVEEALDGLPGVRSVEVDLADDRFDITFDPALTSIAAMLDAIRDLEYGPEVVSNPVASVDVADRVEPASLPENLVALFAEARAHDKPVLLEFTGPG